MNDVKLTLCKTELIARDVYRLTLKGELPRVLPGQFVDIKLPELYLRRPISVCFSDNTTMILIFKVVGKGTELMAQMKPGEVFTALMPLGHGFDLEKSTASPLLVGGGVGTPPLYFLCRELIRRRVTPSVLLGFGSLSDVFYADKFEALGCRVSVATLDGSFGHKGVVTDLLGSVPHSFTYACGPEPMLKALYYADPSDGQYSFEARMGCGFGACMGCSMMTNNGSVRICKDGPVLDKEVIKW